MGEAPLRGSFETQGPGGGSTVPRGVSVVLCACKQELSSWQNLL